MRPQAIRNEANVMESLEHDGIASFVDYFYDPSNYSKHYIIMEKNNGGDLFEFLSERENNKTMLRKIEGTNYVKLLTIKEATQITYNILKAVSYMQKRYWAF